MTGSDRPSTSPSAASVPGRAWIAGLALVALGAVLLIVQFVPGGRGTTLVVGLALFLGFALSRSWGFLVPAGIVTGIGAGILLDLVLIGLGLGFVSIWVIAALLRLKDNHWWPLIPGLVLIVIGAGQAAGEPGRELLRLLFTWWPVGLILAGILLLAGAGWQAARRAR